MHSAAYSSVWRWTSVAIRQVASMESPSKTPKVILVLPMSTARSIPPLQRPLYGMRPASPVATTNLSPSGDLCKTDWGPGGGAEVAFT